MLLAAPVARAQDAGLNIIDTLVLYSEGVAAQYGPEVETAIRKMVHDVNALYAQSGVNGQFRVVATHRTDTKPLAETWNGENGTDNDRLQTVGDGYYDEAHTLRERYGADMVVLLYAQDLPWAGGVAFLKDKVRDGGAPWGAEHAFLTMRLAHPDYSQFGGSSAAVFAHEAGHVLGAGHGFNRTDPVRPGFALANGFKHSAEGPTTLMAYGRKVPFFSSPGLEWNGVALGDERYEDVVGAFNAKGVPEVSAYREYQGHGRWTGQRLAWFGPGAVLRLAARSGGTSRILVHGYATDGTASRAVYTVGPAGRSVTHAELERAFLRRADATWQLWVESDQAFTADVRRVDGRPVPVPAALDVSRALAHVDPAEDGPRPPFSDPESIDSLVFGYRVLRTTGDSVVELVNPHPWRVSIGVVLAASGDAMVHYQDLAPYERRIVARGENLAVASESAIHVLHWTWDLENPDAPVLERLAAPLIPETLKSRQLKVTNASGHDLALRVPPHGSDGWNVMRPARQRVAINFTYAPSLDLLASEKATVEAIVRRTFKWSARNSAPDETRQHTFHVDALDAVDEALAGYPGRLHERAAREARRVLGAAGDPGEDPITERVILWRPHPGPNIEDWGVWAERSMFIEENSSGWPRTLNGHDSVTAQGWVRGTPDLVQWVETSASWEGAFMGFDLRETAALRGDVRATVEFGDSPSASTMRLRIGGFEVWNGQWTQSARETYGYRLLAWKDGNRGWHGPEASALLYEGGTTLGGTVADLRREYTGAFVAAQPAERSEIASAIAATLETEPRRITPAISGASHSMVTLTSPSRYAQALPYHDDTDALVIGASMTSAAEILHPLVSYQGRSIIAETENHGHGLGEHWRLFEGRNDYRGAGTFTAVFATDADDSETLGQPWVGYGVLEQVIAFDDVPGPRAGHDWQGIRFPAYPEPGLRGSLDGQAGTFTCASESFECQFEQGENGWHPRSEVVFVPAGGGDAVELYPTQSRTVATVDHLTFGYWLHVPENVTDFDPIGFGVLAGGGDPFDMQALVALTGSATYAGSATGMYYRAPAAAGDDTGSFEADVTLTANFGTSLDAGSVSGSVRNITYEDSALSLPTALQLQLAAIDPMQNDPWGALPVTGSVVATGTDNAWHGNWAAAFYGNGLTATGHPTGVAGTFGASISDAGIVGSFGARKLQ